MSVCLRPVVGSCVADIRPAEVEHTIRVNPPPPGVAVLACACGRVLDADEMHRLPPSTGDARWLRPIVCEECADRP